MNEQSRRLFDRLKTYAFRIIHLYVALPKSGIGGVLGRQLVRSGTSPGAQYAEACRAKSTADFISKMEGALQELEETGYWLCLIEETQIFAPTRLAPLVDETNQLIAIFTAAIRNTKRRHLPPAPSTNRHRTRTSIPKNNRKDKTSGQEEPDGT